jgi:hypothetical protein
MKLLWKMVCLFFILVVDNEDDCLIIDDAFRKMGNTAQVKKFINGKALLHYLYSLEACLCPSLIVLDNILP